MLVLRTELDGDSKKVISLPLLHENFDEIQPFPLCGSVSRGVVVLFEKWKRAGATSR